MSAAFRLLERADLTSRNSFGIRATARRLVEVSDADALPEVEALMRDHVTGTRNAYVASLKQRVREAGRGGEGAP